MRFAGLDIHKRVVQAHILDEHGRCLARLRFELDAARLAHFARTHLGPDCAVALEATTNTWAVVDALEPHCARLVVSNLQLLRRHD